MRYAFPLALLLFATATQAQDPPGLGFGYLDQADGLLVNILADDGPAGPAGLLVGDVITAVSGKSMAGLELDEIREWFQAVNGAGLPVTLDVIRGGTTLKVEITPAPYSREAIAAKAEALRSASPSADEEADDEAEFARSLFDEIADEMADEGADEFFDRLMDLNRSSGHLFGSSPELEAFAEAMDTPPHHRQVTREGDRLVLRSSACTVRLNVSDRLTVTPADDKETHFRVAGPGLEVTCSDETFQPEYVNLNVDSRASRDRAMETLRTLIRSWDDEPAPTSAPPASPLPPSGSPSHASLDEAIRAFESGNLSAARTGIDAADVQGDRRAEALYWEGRIYAALAQTSDPADMDLLVIAGEAFLEAIAAPPESGEFQVLAENERTTLGSAYQTDAFEAYQAQDFDLAYELFLRAAALQPDAYLPTRMAATVALQNEELEAAVRLLLRLEQHHEDFDAEDYRSLTGAYRMLGRDWLTEGNSGRLNTYLAVTIRATERFPENEELWINRIGALQDVANWQEGPWTDEWVTELESVLQEAIGRFPENDALLQALGTLYSSYAADLRETGRTGMADRYADLARGAYTTLYERDPTSFTANYNLGVFLINKARNLEDDEFESARDKVIERGRLFNEALPHFETAHEAKPDDTAPLIALLQIYSYFGMMEEYRETDQKLEAIRGY